MNLDEWLTYYKSKPGYTVKVEEDGGSHAWFVYDDKGEMIDWWWLSDADQIRPPETVPYKKPGNS